MTMKHIIQPSLEILLGFGFSDDFPCQMNLVTQRIPVRLEIVQEQGRLRPGMMVEATIDVVD